MKSFIDFWGPQPASTRTERLLATIGGVTGIFLVSVISFMTTGLSGAALVVPSMGASAVLLFATPHGPLAQPWALLGGHLLSAIIGVGCASWIGHGPLAAALAVGLAIGAMHLCRCIHPPGGATAIAAVIGGPAIHDLGFYYVLTPVLLNCIILGVTAVVFNTLFAWRRYPLALMRYPHTAAPAHNGLSTEHIQAAIKKLQVFVDVSTSELKTIYDTARDIAVQEKSQLLDIEPGGFYTNGRPGREWSVRQIVDVSPHRESRHHMIIFRTVDGKGLHATGSCTLGEFSEWAQSRVKPRRNAS